MQILTKGSNSEGQTTTHSLKFRTDSGVDVLVMRSTTTGDWTVVYNPDSRSLGKTFRSRDEMFDHYDSITSELKAAAQEIDEMERRRDRETDSDILRKGIQEEWEEFQMAHGQARIPPTHEAHDEAARLVPEGTRGHKPVTVVVKGRPYAAHRDRRYPGTVVFSG